MVLLILITFCVTTVNLGISQAEVKRRLDSDRELDAPLPPPPVTEPVVAPSLNEDHPKRVAPTETDFTDGPEVGLEGGLFAGLPSLAGEIWFHKILGVKGTDVKVGVRYAQDNNNVATPLKYGLVFADGIINLNRGLGAIFYLAGGLNYLASSSGSVSNPIGGEAYLGVKEGCFYAEVGYSAIRTGSASSIKGIDFNIGIKTAF